MPQLSLARCAALSALVAFGFASSSTAQGLSPGKLRPPSLGGAGGGMSGMPGQAAPDPEMQALMQAQMRVMAAQKKALQDPSVEKERAAVEAAIEAAMTKLDPTAKGKLDKLKALEPQVRAAIEADDRAKAQQLLQQGQTLAMELKPLQGKVMEDPKVAKAMAALETKVKAAMKKIDPEVPALIEKLEAAAKRMGMGAPGGAGPMGPPMR